LSVLPLLTLNTRVQPVHKVLDTFVHMWLLYQFITSDASNIRLRVQKDNTTQKSKKISYVQLMYKITTNMLNKWQSLYRFIYLCAACRPNANNLHIWKTFSLQ